MSSPAAAGRHLSLFSECRVLSAQKQLEIPPLRSEWHEAGAERSFHYPRRVIVPAFSAAVRRIVRGGSPNRPLCRSGSDRLRSIAPVVHHFKMMHYQSPLPIDVPTVGGSRCPNAMLRMRRCAAVKLTSSSEKPIHLQKSNFASEINRKFDAVGDGDVNVAKLNLAERD